MIYNIIISEEAETDIKILKKNEPKAYRKLVKLLLELQEHPTSGTGHPKPLSGDRNGQWSRRITDKHRLIYTIIKEKIYVYVLSAYGHYEDK
ncbi:Txe/YoeB family addiction module toxin [Parabacteroides sp. OttesenSCG-928-K15]|nr:Txe/YoeB family addiction module toxin [Parabacteroides sp. OttesenSCG-928-K15]